MVGSKNTDRFDRLTRRVTLLAIACILLPTLILSILVLYTYQSSRRFADELAGEFVPYGVGLVRDRIGERYHSESLALLDTIRERGRPGSLGKMDLTFIFTEQMGLSQTAFQYSDVTQLISPLPEGPDKDRLQDNLSALLEPHMVDSLLHFHKMTIAGKEYALPYIYIYDPTYDTQAILGFVPNTEYFEKELFPNILHTDIFSSPDIFQGEVLEKYFAFVVKRFKTPIAATHIDYTDEELASQPLGDFLPGYDLSIRYRNVRLQILEDLTPNTVIGLIVLLVAVFAVGFYSFLKLAIREIRLSQAKSHFISNVSHELKTPLGLIRLYNETLDMQRFRDEKERHGFHQTITRETVRLANMINRLLSFSRMERGQKQYNFQPHDLQQIVEDVLDDYGRQLEETGFTIERNLDGPIEPLPLDKESISQAVINLLDNAQKYSGERKFVRVSVGEESNGPYVEVADSGIGIPAQDVNKIFEMFYRVEQGLIHDVKGLGIGLAVVKKIVEDHGGRVEVESKVGEGSRFLLRFNRENNGGTRKTRRTR